MLNCEIIWSSLAGWEHPKFYKQWQDGVFKTAIGSLTSIPFTYKRYWTTFLELDIKTCKGDTRSLMWCMFLGDKRPLRSCMHWGDIRPLRWWCMDWEDRDTRNLRWWCMHWGDTRPPRWWWYMHWRDTRPLRWWCMHWRDTRPPRWWCMHWGDTRPLRWHMHWVTPAWVALCDAHYLSHCTPSLHSSKASM